MACRITQGSYLPPRIAPLAPPYPPEQQALLASERELQDYTLMLQRAAEAATWWHE